MRISIFQSIYLYRIAYLRNSQNQSVLSHRGLKLFPTDLEFLHLVSTRQYLKSNVEDVELASQRNYKSVTLASKPN
jgi:hypothetical protein